MLIRKLTLKNYRNHSSLHFTFKPGINVIAGENGAGKTNIAEAIYYLSLGRSFRGVDNLDLIKEGESYASIDSRIDVGGLPRDINVTFFKNQRTIKINKKPITKLSELLKSINVILFEPKDVLLFTGSPKGRRDFLDISLSKQSDIYLKAVTHYEKVLKDRNDILKAPQIDQVLLDTTTDLLIKYAEVIVKMRTAYLKDINDILIKITRALTGTREEMEVVYHPFVEWDEKYTENAKNAFNKALETDLKYKATSIGIHREDFSIKLFGKDIATFGSQGENRLTALALKLAPYFLEKDRDKRPIIVLDDVMSELDAKHQENLINLLKKFDQVFITATRLVIDGASHYHINKRKQ